MSIVDSARDFFEKGRYADNENAWHCETRDQLIARLPNWYNLMSQIGIDDQTCAIVTAVIGELANNAFDHNLGQWKNAVGCFLGLEKVDHRLLVIVADQGQGIVNSLKPVLGNDLNPEDILQKAFTKIISGRAPEKRGNGLKFVIKQLSEAGGIGLYCFSNSSVFEWGKKLKSIDKIKLERNNGTFIVFEWQLK